LKPYDIDENDSSDDEDEDEQEESDDDFYEPKNEHKIDLNLRSKKIDGIQTSTQNNSNKNENIAFVNDLQQQEMIKAFDDMESAFTAVKEAGELQDIPISPYLLEPK
jgi:hypothetical protein